MASGTAVFVTSQSPHRFHFLTGHSQWFLQTVPKLLFIPSLSGAGALLLLCLGRALSEAKFLEPLCPCCCSCRSHWCRCFQHDLPTLSLPCKHGLPLKLFFAEDPPQSRSPRWPYSFSPAACCVCPNAHTGNKWKLSSTVSLSNKGYGFGLRKSWEDLIVTKQTYSVGPFCL